MRDLIQNFYDSIGNEKFGQDFIYRYELNGDSYSLRVETHDRPFEYQWLVYVGGSTKTGNDEYIGQYGEGFKVSMLGYRYREVADDQLAISTQHLTVLTNCDITTIVRREKERKTEAMNFRRKYLGSDSRYGSDVAVQIRLEE